MISRTNYLLAFRAFLTLGLIFGTPVKAIADGDPAAGKKVYQACAGCHTLAKHKDGPRHCGLLGRKAGTEKGFSYSSAMQNAGLVWDAATLDKFIASPSTVVPGTKMTFPGISDKTQRKNLIAYLAKASQSKEVCGTKKKKSEK